MPNGLCLVTGATGLLGSRLVEQLLARGHAVRALVRPTSDTTRLKSLPVERATGDLCDAASLTKAVDGVETVYHCAAKVGDWGPWSTYQRETVEAAGNLVEACRHANVARLLHVSSVSVYGHPRGVDRPFTEDEPLGQNLWLWEYYPRSKIAAEQLVRTLGDRATIVRPSWIYGPGDRTVIPRIIKAIRTGRISIVGSGDNLLNMVYVDDVADGCIRAASHPQAGGQTYNLTSQGEVSQRELLDKICDTLALPRVKRRIPLRLAMRFGLLSECIGKLIRLKRAPYVTRRGVYLLSRSTQYSSQRAQAELGWRPQVDAAEGLQKTLDWIKATDPISPPPSRQA